MRASYVEPILKQHTFPSADDGCRWAGAATSIALVHVGKTGGESLVNMLQGAGVAFTWIHDPGAFMVFDDPHRDPAEECWWPPQVALASEHSTTSSRRATFPVTAATVASGDALRAHQPDFARSPTKFSTEYRSGVGVGRIIESACIHGTREPRLIDVLVQPLNETCPPVCVWHAAVAYCSVALWLESTC